MNANDVFSKKGLIAFLLALTLILLGFASYLNHVLMQGEMLRLDGTIENQLSTKVSEVEKRLESSRERLRFLSDTPPIEGIVRALNNQGYDAQDETDLAQWRVRLTTIFRAFAAHNPDIDQIRYIKVEDGGREFIRVERRGGKIRTVPEFELQQKGDRNYFKETLLLGSQEIYISDINLNRERGHIEQPRKPTYRVSTPIYDQNGEPKAILIINFNANQLINDIAQNLPEHLVAFGIGEQGQFFMHPDSGRTFTNEYNVDFQSALQQLEALPGEIGHGGAKLYRDTRTGKQLYLSMRSIPIGFKGSIRALALGVYTDMAAFEASLARKSLSWNGMILAIYLVMLVAGILYLRVIQRKLQTAQTLSVYEAMLQSANMPIISVDTEFCIRSLNPVAEEVFSCSRRTALGKSLSRVVEVDQEHQINFERLEKDAREGLFSELEVTFTGRKGEKRIMLINLSPVTFRGQNESSGAVLIFYDVTRERALTREIEEVNQGLERKVTERTGELNAAKEEAERANQTKSLFIANISHELRTPMNGVFGMLNLIKKEKLSDQQRHYLSLAENSATTLTEIINSVLDISKIEANKLELDIGQFDLETVASELVQSGASRAAEKDVELLLDTCGLQHKDILADVTRIKQVLTNLVSNAIKFTEHGHVLVTLSSHLSGKNVVINFSVKDTGIGIEEEAIDKLFQPFTQADNSITRRFGGTGLGLSITRQLCRLMEGDISVSSESGKGSCFEGYFVAALGAPSQTRTDLSASMMVALVGKQDEMRMDLIMRQFQSWHLPVLSTEVDLLSEQLDKVDEGLEKIVVVVDYTQLDAHGEALLNQLDGHGRASQIRLVFITKPLEVLHCAPPYRLELIHLPQPITATALRHALLETPLGQDEVCEMDEASIANDYKDVKGMKVLVVDDNAINRVVVKGGLKEVPVQLYFATNGEEALEQLKAESEIDLVLMDCQMPVMDGYAATQAIRRGEGSDRHIQVPVVAMTASAMAGDRERCLQSGMSDYMTKPLDQHQLIQKVVYWLKVRRVKISDKEDQNPA